MTGIFKRTRTKEIISTWEEFIRIIKEMMNDGTTKPDTYMSISEKFMQGEISEDEFVERYN